MVLTISPQIESLQCQGLWHPANTQLQMPATDDHPFVYLQGNQIPLACILTMLFILLTTTCLMKLTGVTYRQINNHLDLFFMGAAFMLLETKSIINFALYFGTTWFVNALVFIGILLTVYLSIEITQRTIMINRRVILYASLIASLLLYWLIQNSFILALPVLLRYLIVTILAFLPILIANLIFADRFRHTSHSLEGFGANLLGAVLGGLLEYSSLIMGYHNLT